VNEANRLEKMVGHRRPGPDLLGRGVQVLDPEHVSEPVVPGCSRIALHPAGD
jgi:hypothetical protein